jgi:hypothetical protein
MRLNKIKLAGFKSFVDPTAVNFPSNLIGVVGPNGCGKSNIIDAVRWVMGEISAKHLRGDSMADVVFNGSSSRKPVGTASVELVFDNSDGQLAGQYAGYAEVSLKRVVSRDGTSAYFLNGARCRRKDITQLFLGTGLGSRSYAIIEQGMISRVIEARPEELRGFIAVEGMHSARARYGDAGVDRGPPRHRSVDRVGARGLHREVRSTERGAGPLLPDAPRSRAPSNPFSTRASCVSGSVRTSNRRSRARPKRTCI